MSTFEPNFAETPFRDGQWSTLGELRTIAKEILRETKGDPDVAACMRAQDRKVIPWAKSWMEELYPFKLLADRVGLPDDAAYRWTPLGAADFEVGGETGFAIQYTTNALMILRDDGWAFRHA
jgi:hypothetical protein